MSMRSNAPRVVDPPSAPPRAPVDLDPCVEEPLLRVLLVRSRSDAVVAASVARTEAIRLGFPSTAARAVEIAAAELANNIARHAGEGELRLHGRPSHLEVVAFDRGPGIGDPTAACADRHSRGRRLDADAAWITGLGCGLGAVHRLMDGVEIRSALGRGTCIVAHKSVPLRA